MSRFDTDYQIHIIHIPALGWLPTVQDSSGEETYRGEYQDSPAEALDLCMEMVAPAADQVLGLSA